MNRRILRLALPNIISNITVPLLGTVDLAIMGHLESPAYIGAIALAGMVFNLVYLNFGFLRMGTSGFTAQAYGAGNHKEAVTVLYRALLVSLSAGALLLLVQLPIAGIAFRITEGSAEVKDLARQYFFIRIWAAPATISLYALSGWFLGMQDAKTPMWTALIVNLINIGMNLLFVLHLGMKSDGVAWGTLIAQYSGLGFMLWILLKRHRKILFKPVLSHLIAWASFRPFFRVNRDIFIRTVLLTGVFALFTNASAGMGDLYLAVNTLLFQYLLFFSYFIDGFAFASEALVGKAIGMNDRVLLNKTIRSVFRWGFIITLPFTLVYIVLGDRILTLLTSQQDIILASRIYLPWVMAVPLLSFAAFLWDGIYIGATASRAMRNSMLIAAVLIYLPLSYLLPGIWENHGLWVALLAFMLTRGLALTVMAKPWVRNPLGFRTC